jgi:hypothetical protein
MSSFNSLSFEFKYHCLTNIVSTPTVEGGVSTKSTGASSQTALEDPE